jgi:hypothetical protein
LLQICWMQYCHACFIQNLNTRSEYSAYSWIAIRLCIIRQQNIRSTHSPVPNFSSTTFIIMPFFYHDIKTLNTVFSQKTCLCSVPDSSCGEPKNLTLFLYFQDDNFVLSAVFCAIEEDNKTGLEELLAMANIDISQVRRGQYLPQSGLT